MSNVSEYLMPHLPLDERRFLLACFSSFSLEELKEDLFIGDIARRINYGYLTTEKHLNSLVTKFGSVGGQYIIYRGNKLKPKFKGKDLNEARYIRGTDNRLIREITLFTEKELYDPVYVFTDNAFREFVLQEHKEGRWLSLEQDKVSEGESYSVA